MGRDEMKRLKPSDWPTCPICCNPAVVKPNQEWTWQSRCWFAGCMFESLLYRTASGAFNAWCKPSRGEMKEIKREIKARTDRARETMILLNRHDEVDRWSDCVTDTRWVDGVLPDLRRKKAKEDYEKYTADMLASGECPHQWRTTCNDGIKIVRTCSICRATYTKTAEKFTTGFFGFKPGPGVYEPSPLPQFSTNPDKPAPTSRGTVDDPSSGTSL